MVEAKKPEKLVEVLAGKRKSTKDKKGKTRHKHTHIEHHPDGSHTVRHTPVDGQPEVSYAAANLDAVHRGLNEHVVGPLRGQEEEEGLTPDAGTVLPRSSEG